ncbi:hypothetical protein OHS33_34015 [Streptomyces sp. NBC_00536]|uniref:hypothetical protein n=1 Tax=Streptomyces sp. NBC_00536 TaxID=2975769 RepID=UPI002E803728|nr:hypothetical protein [Streptomyces sp. NBC_00536]WUC82942.1 hypothetical protein OHS33_34015 [Streptomyces sp. NBC_00536]
MPPRVRFLCAPLAAALALLSGCGAGGGGDGGGRAVSQDEAQLLALVRLSAYESSPAALTVRVPGPAGVTVVEAVVDYRTRRASGTFTVPGRTGVAGALAWDDGSVSVDPAGGPRRWSRRAYTRDPLDRALRLTLQLGHDRPENAQLLAQSGAQWLGRRSLPGADGRPEGPYAVFAGPRPPRHEGAQASPLTYWVDAKGALRRVEARLTGEGPAATVDFTGTVAGPTTSAGPQPPVGEGSGSG